MDDRTTEEQIIRTEDLSINCGLKKANEAFICMVDMKRTNFLYKRFCFEVIALFLRRYMPISPKSNNNKNKIVYWKLECVFWKIDTAHIKQFQGLVL
jgi:hypothetical protein